MKKWLEDELNKRRSLLFARQYTNDHVYNSYELEMNIAYKSRIETTVCDDDIEEEDEVLSPLQCLEEVMIGSLVNHIMKYGFDTVWPQVELNLKLVTSNSCSIGDF